MKVKVGQIFALKDPDFFVKITAVGRTNVCFQYSHSLEDLERGICHEDAAPTLEFLNKYAGKDIIARKIVSHELTSMKIFNILGFRLVFKLLKEV